MQNDEKEFSSSSYRVSGVFLLVIGALLSKYFIYDWIEALKAGQQLAYARYQLKGTCLGVAALIWGPVMLFAGKSTLDRFVKLDPKKISWQQAVFYIVPFALGVGVVEWMNYFYQ